MDKYLEYILEQMKMLLAIDSPSGYTQEVTDYLMEEYKRLGYLPEKTVKGGVLVDLERVTGQTGSFWKHMWIPWVLWSQRSRVMDG